MTNRRLGLRSETLTELTVEELTGVNGAVRAITVDRCTGLEPSGQIRCAQITFTNCWTCVG